MCDHQPSCPSGTDQNGVRARIVAGHPEQGWYLLCNGVVLFDDSGEILPNGDSVAARRAELTAAALHRVA